LDLDDMLVAEDGLAGFAAVEAADAVFDAVGFGGVAAGGGGFDELRIG
jgi:hypothetical protein